MEDLVTGNAQDDSQERRILKSHSSKNEILSYLRRLKRHYDTIAKDFDNQDPFYRLQSQGVYFENNITCNDYSYILIALMLIFKGLHIQSKEIIMVISIGIISLNWLVVL